MCFSHKVCSFLLSNFKPGQVIYLKEKKKKDHTRSQQWQPDFESFFKFDLICLVVLTFSNKYLSKYALLVVNDLQLGTLLFAAAQTISSYTAASGLSTESSCGLNRREGSYMSVIKVVGKKNRSDHYNVQVQFGTLLQTRSVAILMR